MEVWLWCARGEASWPAERVLVAVEGGGRCRHGIRKVCMQTIMNRLHPLSLALLPWSWRIRYYLECKVYFLCERGRVSEHIKNVRLSYA